MYISNRNANQWCVSGNKYFVLIDAFKEKTWAIK